MLNDSLISLPAMRALRAITGLLCNAGAKSADEEGLHCNWAQSNFRQLTTVPDL